MTQQDSSRQADIARAIALLDRYGFDTKGHLSTQLIARWLELYEPHWIRLAAIEALYQGRYKVISVEQILNLWHRRGQPAPHFNGDFERLISRKLPELARLDWQVALGSESEYPYQERPSIYPGRETRIRPFGAFSRIELRKRGEIRRWQVSDEPIPEKIRQLTGLSPIDSPPLPALAIPRVHAGLSRIFSLLESDLFILAPQLALPPARSRDEGIFLEEDSPEQEWVLEINPQHKDAQSDRQASPVKEKSTATPPQPEANLSLEELETIDLLDELEKIEAEKKDAQIKEKKAKPLILPNPDLSKLHFFQSGIVTFTPSYTNLYFLAKLKRFSLELNQDFNPKDSDAIALSRLE